MEDALLFISRYRRFAIIGHEEPDGDCLCSQLAMASYLERTGKKAQCYTPGPFIRPEIMDLEPYFLTGAVEQADAAIIVDCSTVERIGGYAVHIESLPTLVIDHHASGMQFGDTRIIEPSAPSVTYMILALIEAAGHIPTDEEASLLLFGLCTDTGFFRHLDGGSGSVFEAVSRLTQAGASPKEAFSRMYGNRSFKSRRLLGRLLDRSEQRLDGRLIVTRETESELTEFGKLERDSNALYQQLQGVKNGEVVVLIRQEEPGLCSVSLRSLHEIDVGAVAKHFGGGGHPRAAGYSRDGNVDAVASEIIGYIENDLGL